MASYWPIRSNDPTSSMSRISLGLKIILKELFQYFQSLLCRTELNSGQSEAERSAPKPFFHTAQLSEKSFDRLNLV